MGRQSPTFSKPLDESLLILMPTFSRTSVTPTISTQVSFLFVETFFEQREPSDQTRNAERCVFGDKCADVQDVQVVCAIPGPTLQGAAVPDAREPLLSDLRMPSWHVSTQRHLEPLDSPKPFIWKHSTRPASPCFRFDSPWRSRTSLSVDQGPRWPGTMAGGYHTAHLTHPLCCQHLVSLGRSNQTTIIRRTRCADTQATTTTPMFFCIKYSSRNLSLGTGAVSSRT